MSTDSTTAIDTLIHARWVIPVQPRRTVLDHHAIAISGNKIIDLLPSSQAREKYQPDETVELGQHVLTPGLINAHCHGAMALFRGMADDQPLYSWLENHIWPAEGQWVDEQFVHDGSQLAIAEMLRSGTTCFSDMYFFPNITAQAAVDVGIRAQLGFPVFEHPSAWGQGSDDYIRKGLQVRDDFKHSALVNVVFGPHAPYSVDDPALQRIAMLAAELDIHIHIHTHETAQEVEESLQKTGKRPLQRLNELGILSPKAQLVHMTAINGEDIELVVQSGAHIIHCPESNLKLASGFCPVQDLRNQGINIALGTDGAASNNDLDLFGEMRTAALLAKAVANDAAALTDWETLEMATLNGAKALGMDDRVGSLEVGKEADIIAIDLSALEQQPVYQPISQLVYTACGHRVSHSWINGRCVMKDRQLTTMNQNNIIERASHWRNKIKPDSTAD